MDSERGSDFITAIALVPPSPPRPDNLDLHYDIQGQPVPSPPFHTPSYNGSYHGSPFSQHSELCYTDDIDFNLLQDFTAPINEYEPSEYDVPEQAGSLLLFEAEYMTSHFSPTNNGDHRSPFDPSSPSSNASLHDDANNGRHSRASSVGSNNHPSPSLPAQSQSPQPSFHASPRLDVTTNSFGNMSVHTPDWASAQLPSQPISNTDVSLTKAPRLALSDNALDDQNSKIPIINAPDGGPDDMMDGPQLHIVPATPIGAVLNTRANFQTPLSRLNQEVDHTSSVANDGRQQQQQQQQRQPSQQRSQPPSRGQSPFKFSSDTATPNYVFPDAPGRSRSHSDAWNPSGDAPNGLAAPPFDYNSQQQQVQRMQQQQRQQLQTFQFGGGPSNDFLSPNSMQRSASDSLTAPRQHRVSRSEDIRPQAPTYNPSVSPNPGYTHHQSSNSMGGGSNLLFPPSATEYQLNSPTPQYLHPNMMGQQQPSGSQQLPPVNRLSLSPGRGHFRRGSSGTRSDRGAEAWVQGPAAPLGGTRRVSPYPSPNASPHIRYTELEFEPTLDPAPGGYQQQQIGPGMGLGLGVAMGGGPVGISMGLQTEIGEPPVSAGFSEEIGLSGRGTYMGSGKNTQARSEAGSSIHGNGTTRAESQNGAGSNRGDPTQPVAKANVTSGRTANASHRRRKQDANFACNVPGCGSTFTRGFNLKGHLRSHYEQKPYKCHWPGCGKGFARQHDCKRHEQLHSNFRPFECEGCQKQFARMDALNRHLKSDAGKECVVIVERNRAMGVGSGQGLGGQEGMGMGQNQLMVMSDEEYEPELELEVERKPRRRGTRGGGGGGDGVLDWSVAL